MEYKNTKSWVARSREIDEPYVITALQNYGINATQGDVVADWQHIDLFANIEGRLCFIDVKRNHSSQKESTNYTFTYINSKGNEFIYRDNGYFAFIDDMTGKVYLIRHYIIQNAVKTSKKFVSKFNEKERYILLSKAFIAQYSDIVLDGDKSKLR